ncbi:MAG TPA: GxxExxY protein, partial [Chitinophagaceae bacterium]
RSGAKNSSKRMTENEIAKIVLDVAFKIHKELGPGLFESVYEAVMEHELVNEYKLDVQRQRPIPVVWKGVKLELGFRADLIVGNKVIVELKSIEALAPVHPKQVLTHLRLTGIKLGLLINFNEELLKNGIKRIVNNL